MSDLAKAPEEVISSSNTAEGEALEVVESTEDSNSRTETAVAAEANPQDEEQPPSQQQQPPMDAEMAAAWGFALTQLARQLEYYLSVQNLSKDTYVQTLRSLNDSCVPVSILANFTKVRQILLPIGIIDDTARQEAVCQAVTQCSKKLRIASVDTKTGKEIAHSDDVTASHVMIYAVGTMDNEPIAELEPPVALPSPEEVANTLVLRDVPPQVDMEEIHAVFQFEGCPPVVSIAPDVAQCWFVQLDTRDRATVTNVLLQLRNATLGGEPVHARIKSSVTSAAALIDPAPLMYTWQADSLSSNKNQTSNGQQQQRRKKKSNNRKKKSNKNGNTEVQSNSNGNNRSKKTGNRESNSGNNNNNKSNPGNSNNGQNKKQKNKSSGSSNANGSDKATKAASPSPSPASTPSKKKAIAPVPPSLGVEDFPTLQDNRVEWETTPVDSQKKDMEEDDDQVKSIKIGSDSASTATTASSSTDAGAKKIGYAAALKKTDVAPMVTKALSTPPPSPAVAKKEKRVPVKAAPAEAVVEEEEPPAPVVVNPPSWGAGRSFADILREAQTAS